MTNNSREMAIEKLFSIFNLAYSEHESLNVSTCEKAGIGAILDALNIEVVSKESEVRAKDVVFSRIHEDWDAFISDYVDHIQDGAMYTRNCASSSQWIGLVKDKRKKIIQRNDKPVIYVENIGVKNDK
jgi:hypothetical protein